MGIQGLMPFLRKRTPGAISFWSPEDTRASCAVDATLYLCRIFYGNERIETAEQLAAAYLEFHSSLLSLNLDPVHVFDGPSSHLKRYAHVKRAKDLEANRSSLDMLRKRQEAMAQEAYESIVRGVTTSNVKIVMAS